MAASRATPDVAPHAKSRSCAVVAAGLALIRGSVLPDAPRGRQLTSSALHRVLDNNDHFSRDGRFLCLDTRDTLGRGPANSTRLPKADLRTGEETVVYAPHPVTVSDTAPAPGVLAASHSPAAGEIVRGSPDGRRVAYFAKAPDGSPQVFVIPARGSDHDPDPALRPVQVTRLERGAASARLTF